MSHGKKLARDPSLLQSDNYTLLGGSQGFQSKLVNKGGNIEEISIQDSNCSVEIRTDFQGQARQPQQLVFIQPNSAKNYQFLPYKEGKCTCVELDDSSNLFLTGPLSGCYVEVGETRSQTIVFHANANQQADPHGYKIGLIRTAFTRDYGGSGWVTNHQLRSRDYHGYISFVIGCRPNPQASKTWDFYVYGYNATGTLFKKF